MDKENLRQYVSSALGLFSLFLTASAGGFDVVKDGVTSHTENVRSVGNYAKFDVVNAQRVRFAANHGVSAPAALVSAVKQCPMAELLISMAIEESLGNPVAVGRYGEKGAWQVLDSYWGDVPEDLHGQAGQAERIMRELLISVKGDKKEALARYNGGGEPSGRSYRYAERILKRADQLQFAANFLPPDGITALQN